MGLTQKLGTIPLAILTDSSNNVGIGGSANASFKLQVTGTTNLTGALSGTSATFSGEVGVTSGLLSISGAGATPPTGGVGFRFVSNRLIIYGGSSDITFQKNDNSGPNLTILNSGAATFSGLVSVLSTSYDSGAEGLKLGYDSSYYNAISATFSSAAASNKMNFVVSSGNGTRGIVMTLQGAGNVGIGNSPNAWDGIFRALQIGNYGSFIAGRSDSQDQLFLGTNAYYGASGWVRQNSTFATRFFMAGGEHYFDNAVSNTAGTSITWDTRMKITSGGNVLIGTTTDNGSKLQVNGSVTASSYGGAANIGVRGAGANGISDGPFYQLVNTTNSYQILSQINANTDYDLWAFRGSWTKIGTTSATTGVYTPLSDRNKKKDFEDSTIGLDAILNLKPTLYRMKTDETEGNKELGFIAQEVKDFIPQAYVESDEFIGLNYNAIVAALVKSIQELKAEIDILKNK